MPTINLKVTKVLGEDLTALCSLGEKTVQKISEGLHASDQTIIKPADLRSALGAAVDSDAAQVVERVVVGLSNLRRQSHLTVEEVLQSLENAIRLLDWDDDLLKSWAASRGALKTLLDEPSVNVTAKAVDLLYDHDHFFVEARILTNIRPIFDDKRDSVLGAAINQVLRLEYSNTKGERTNVTLAMDEDDIKWLRSACDDALLKGKTLAREIADKWKIGSLTIDELNNDRS
jgi:hypothetical protein